MKDMAASLLWSFCSVVMAGIPYTLAFMLDIDAAAQTAAYDTWAFLCLPVTLTGCLYLFWLREDNATA